ENFHAAARLGVHATVHWPRLGEVRVTDLVLEWLLPKAYEGLDRYGVDGRLRDRLLGIVEQRCLTGRTGAVWQLATVEAEERRGRRPDLAAARLRAVPPSPPSPVPPPPVPVPAAASVREPLPVPVPVVVVPLSACGVRAAGTTGSGADVSAGTRSRQAPNTLA